jgi:type II secretory pathway pseudopilin PulG
VNRLADIIVVTILIVLAAVASTVLANSYKKLWRGALRNSSPLNAAETVYKDQAPPAVNQVEAASVEAIQAPLQENRPAQDNTHSISVAPSNDAHEKPPETHLNIEQPAATVAVAEATQQAASAEESKATPKITRGARRKKTTSHTRSTSRSRKKVSKAQPSTESQPPS